MLSKPLPSLARPISINSDGVAHAGRRLEQQGIRQAEDRRRRADAERQGNRRTSA